MEVDRMVYAPSEYAEKFRTLTSEVSTVTGKFKYNRTPYLREIVDTLSPYHPAKVISVIKSSQIGFTEGVIVNGILWMIANNPGNCLMLSANDDLSKEVIEIRLDQGLQSCGIQHLIRPNVIRKRNQRTGDTSKYKEYAGGRLFAGGLNSIDKLARQRSVRYGFFDDWDAAKISDKDQGNLFDLIQKRFSTSAKSMKQYYISTPETRPSNIEKVYLMGDQRKWMVPCPLCGEYINITWYQEIDKKVSGITFQKDEDGGLIEDSVALICPECSGSIKERYKYDMNLKGKWVPTAKPSRPGFYSYHINAFTNAPNMFTWTDYAREWLDIYKDNQTNRSKLKVFINQVKGEAWEETRVNIKSNQLQKNTREYQIGTVPTKLSKDDGNGHIILLTCAADLNGTLDDGRLDYEVQAHSESGSVYSIDHGSIGTYYPKSQDEERIKWTYQVGKKNNVWDYLVNNVINKRWPTDEGGEMTILITGIDTGWLTHHAYEFIDNATGFVVGVKGKVDDDKFTKVTLDAPKYKPARERPNLYILESNMIKDDLAEMMSKKWTRGEPQPAGFMNFPESSEGKYQYRTYFVQLEAESKELEKNEDGDPVGWRWNKKNQGLQNHFFDCSYYNQAIKMIIAQKICKEADIKNATWADFAGIMRKILN